MYNRARLIRGVSRLWEKSNFFLSTLGAGRVHPQHYWNSTRDRDFFYPCVFLAFFAVSLVYLQLKRGSVLSFCLTWLQRHNWGVRWGSSADPNREMSKFTDDKLEQLNLLCLRATPKILTTMNTVHAVLPGFIKWASRDPVVPPLPWD